MATLHPIRDSVTRRILPRLYVEGFVDPEVHVDGAPAVWVHRPSLGVFQATPVEPRGGERHFNVPDERSLRYNAGLERRLAEVEDDAARLVRQKLPERSALDAGERDVLASLFALIGIRLSSRFADLDDAEAARGYEQLHAIVREMGWVFWEAEPPDYFVSSSAPLPRGVSERRRPRPGTGAPRARRRDHASPDPTPRPSRHLGAARRALASRRRAGAPRAQRADAPPRAGVRAGAEAGHPRVKVHLLISVRGRRKGRRRKGGVMASAQRVIPYGRPHRRWPGTRGEWIAAATSRRPSRLGRASLAICRRASPDTGLDASLALAIRSGFAACSRCAAVTRVASRRPPLHRAGGREGR